jgi:hypothetical protein
MSKHPLDDTVVELAGVVGLSVISQSILPPFMLATRAPAGRGYDHIAPTRWVEVGHGEGAADHAAPSQYFPSSA